MLLHVPVSAVYCVLVLVRQCLHIVFLSVCHLLSHLIFWHGGEKNPKCSVSGAAAISQTLSFGSPSPFAVFTTVSISVHASGVLRMVDTHREKCSSDISLLCFTAAGGKTHRHFLPRRSFQTVIRLRWHSDSFTVKLTVLFHSYNSMFQHWVRALHYTVSLASYCVYLFWMWKNLSRLYLTQRQ